MRTEIINDQLRTHLNRVFLTKCESNPSYSLRAYARDLKVDATLLSRLMKGERAISEVMRRRLATELNLPLSKSMHLLGHREPKLKGKFLLDDAFNPISKWYFFAILELFMLKNFKSDAKWIAKKLNLSLSETNAALEVLTVCGHINRDQIPWRVEVEDMAWTNFNATTRERMNYQRQLIDKAREAIEQVGFDRRENASLTLAASADLVPEIKLRIQNFKNELRELVEGHKNYGEVYQLVISYFPFTNEDK